MNEFNWLSTILFSFFNSSLCSEWNFLHKRYDVAAYLRCLYRVEFSNSSPKITNLHIKNYKGKTGSVLEWLYRQQTWTYRLLTTEATTSYSHSCIAVNLSYHISCTCLVYFTLVMFNCLQKSRCVLYALIDCKTLTQLSGKVEYFFNIYYVT